MKHCDNCKVDINTNKNYCPLCYGEIEGENCQDLIYKTKDMEPRIFKHRLLTTKIFLFISLCATIICMFVNFITTPKVLWSLIVAFSVLYVWILVRHTIISRRNFFEKILFQFLGISSVLLLSNIISGGGAWFWNYVLPSVALVTTIVTLILCFSFSKKGHLASFFLLFILMLIMSGILLLAKIDTFKLLSQINIVFNTLNILGILIFNFKGLKKSFTKNFNL